MKSSVKYQIFIDSWEKDGFFFVKHFHMVLAKQNHPFGFKTSPYNFFFNFITFDPLLGTPFDQKALNLH